MQSPNQLLMIFHMQIYITEQTEGGICNCIESLKPCNNKRKMTAMEFIMFLLTDSNFLSFFAIEYKTDKLHLASVSKLMSSLSTTLKDTGSECRRTNRQKSSDLKKFLTWPYLT
jgi:hypothetical protein